MTGPMSDDGRRPRVLVSNRQSGPVDEPGLVSLAAATLIAEGRPSAELSLSFVTEEEMADLHEGFMGEPGPTDVLSFPQDRAGSGGGIVDGASVLGDVVIAPSVAARNNPDDPPAELRLLLVHGILHLLGYDHESDADRAAMWARQERYSGVRAS